MAHFPRQMEGAPVAAMVCIGYVDWYFLTAALPIAAMRGRRWDTAGE